MRHFPVFLDLRGQTVVVSGAGETAEAKLRLLLKTEADVRVFAADASEAVANWAAQGVITLHHRAISEGDADGAALFYAANADATEDARVAEIARRSGVLVNIVDDLEASAFITPAIVDRAPVTVAIGTEGAAPVLARGIKSKLEEILPSSLGALTGVGQAFRSRVAHLSSRARREFWSRFYFETGPRAIARGENEAMHELERLLSEGVEAASELVQFVGAGPGDPELLTLRARQVLHEADVVIYDRFVSSGVLELARREAVIVETGNAGSGANTAQGDINDLIVSHARAGVNVVRLTGGDPVLSGQLDEETNALDNAGVLYEIVPGVTSASAAAAAIGRALTGSGRNLDFRVLTGRDVGGFVEQDWRSLVRAGSTAAFHMTPDAAVFICGRLLMHGADPARPVTLVENASRIDQRIVPATLSDLPSAVAGAGFSGPVLMLLGVAPRDVRVVTDKAQGAL